MAHDAKPGPLIRHLEVRSLHESVFLIMRVAWHVLVWVGREDAPAAKPSSTREDTVLTAPEKFTTLEKTRSEGNLLVPLPTAAGDIV